MDLFAWKHEPRTQTKRADPESTRDAEEVVQSKLRDIGAISLWPKIRKSVRAYARRKGLSYADGLQKLVRILDSGDIPSWALTERDERT